MLKAKEPLFDKEIEFGRPIVSMYKHMHRW